MICEYCNKEHDGTYASGRFCNKKCASAFSTKEKRVEINKKVSIKAKAFCLAHPGQLVARPFKKGYDPNRYVLTKEKLAELIAKRRLTRIKRVSSLPFDELNHWEKRDKVFMEQEGKCAICGIEKWLDKKITLEFHHRDGNRLNETRKNVEFLCPNCHSQTKDYRMNGKNHSANAKKKMSIKSIEQHLRRNGRVAQLVDATVSKTVK